MKERDTFERAYGNSCYSILPLHLLDFKCGLKLMSDAKSFPNKFSFIYTGTVIFFKVLISF